MCTQAGSLYSAGLKGQRATEEQIYLADTAAPPSGGGSVEVLLLPCRTYLLPGVPLRGRLPGSALSRLPGSRHSSTARPPRDRHALDMLSQHTFSWGCCSNINCSCVYCCSWTLTLAVRKASTKSKLPRRRHHLMWPPGHGEQPPWRRCHGARLARRHAGGAGSKHASLDGHCSSDGSRERWAPRLLTAAAGQTVGGSRLFAPTTRRTSVCRVESAASKFEKLNRAVRARC
jgi:hypothetical protein